MQVTTRYSSSVERQKGLTASHFNIQLTFVPVTGLVIVSVHARVDTPIRGSYNAFQGLYVFGQVDAYSIDHRFEPDLSQNGSDISGLSVALFLSIYLSLSNTHNLSISLALLLRVSQALAVSDGKMTCESCPQSQESHV